MGWPCGYLLFCDCTRYRIDNGTVSWIRDRNGNKITFAYDTSYRVTTITDSLNRQITVEYDVNDISPYGLCDRIHFKGAGGVERIVRISKTNMGSALRSGYNLQTPHDLFPGLDGSYYNYEPTVASKRWLPNSDGTGQHYQYYQFFYNSYGQLARVELPTGGAIEYDIQADPGIISSAFCTEIYRRVIERRIYVDGATLTNYDALGRAYQASNPYRSGESIYWTTTAFDPLSRASSVTTPDNAAVTTSYYGNSVTVSDQAGKA